MLFYWPAVLVHEVKCLSDYRFPAKDCAQSLILLQVNMQIMNSPSTVCGNSFLALHSSSRKSHNMHVTVKTCLSEKSLKINWFGHHAGMEDVVRFSLMLKAENSGKVL